MNYDKTKRQSFQTVGELRKLLATLADDTPIAICGSIKAWFHADCDKTVVCLDYEDLEEEYENEEE